MNNISVKSSDDTIEILLEQWHIWLDLLLEAGLANIPSSVTQKIYQWAASAEIIGFQQQALMSRQLLGNEQSIESKVEAFYKLLTQYEVIKRLYEVERLIESYAD